MTPEVARPTNYDEFIAPFTTAVTSDNTNTLQWFWRGPEIPREEDGKPLVPFHETQFSQIAALDPRLHNRTQRTLVNLCKYIIHPPNHIFEHKVGTAMLFYPIHLIDSHPHTLVGICAEGKVMEGYWVPLGEKPDPFDILLFDLRHEVTLTEYYIFGPLVRILGTIRRGVVEEIGPLDPPTSLRLNSEIRRFYPDFIHLDLATLFLNFPVIGRATDELVTLLEPLLRDPRESEWASPLEWVPVTVLCEEQYRGSPIPQGVRFVANELIKSNLRHYEVL